ncbi:MAG: 4Fe-4S binding protein [Anaerolinea sp.]|nr:4Fe-4S binding protein [Anaerolinea sp.]
MMHAGTQQVGLYVDNGRCQNCRQCLAQKSCQLRAIVRIDRDEPPFVDVHRCHDCRVCVAACPFHAIRTI